MLQKKIKISNFEASAVKFFWGEIGKLEKNNAYLRWSSKALASINTLLNDLFFTDVRESGDPALANYINPFFENRGKLNQDAYTQFCKIFIGCYLYLYFLNPTSNFASINLRGKDALEQKIFELFSFTNNDIATYRSWNRERNDPLHNFKLYGLLIEGLGLDIDKFQSSVAAMHLTAMTIPYFKSFLTSFNKDIHYGVL